MIQFNLEEWLQDKSRKVVTRCGKPVRIVCWDVKSISPIIGIIQDKSGGEFARNYALNGRYSTQNESEYDLFFADEEEQLTDFEKELNRIVIAFSDAHAYMDKNEIHHYSKGLLDLARKEIEKDNIIIDKDKYLKICDQYYNNGKQNALKFLPKWKKAHEHKEFPLHVCVMDENMYPFLDTEVNEDEYYIELSDLKTLPKEE